MTVLHFARALTPEGWRSDVRVALDGARIASVESGAAARSGDERHALGLPALANLHSHAFQRAMAGLAERRGDSEDTFWTWRETMYRHALAMDPDQIEAVAAQAYVEMLEAGFSAVAEFHYLHNAPDGAPYARRAELAERIVAAAAETGVGLTLLPVFYGHATFGGAPPRPEQRRFITNLDGFARLMEDSRALAPVVGVAPHSLRAVTPQELASVTALCGDGPIHIHVAEQTKEVEDRLAWSGARPVRWLLDHAAVNSRWCAIHATHMDDGEAEALAASGAVAGLCPITEANLGDGVFNPRFFERGGAFGVGSDSNVEVSLATELKQLEYAQRLRRRQRNALAPLLGSTGRALFEGAAVGGAQALRRASGRIEAAAFADLVSLDRASPHLAGREDDAALDTWIFTGARLVDCVWSAGVRLVDGGRHRAREAVAARFARVQRRLAEALNDAPLHARIRADVEARILSGEWPPGHRIPFEHELTRAYGCSRMTVSKALTELAGAGLIERRRKAGSFVRRPLAQSAVLEIHDVAAEVASLGAAYGYRLLARARRRAAARERLAVAPGAPLLKLRCLHEADGRPFCLEERLINLEAAPEAVDTDFDLTPPGAWLIARIPWTAAEHRIRATCAGDAAGALDLDPAEPCLVIERRTYLGEAPVTHVALTYPGAAHELVARFSPQSTPRG